ncbi:hypothetical protein ACIQWB_01000 [Streptomyces olivaceus]|uniref:hypothetical protein n=1 Tax=Streptomyces olivaceus TaxID=47716 RepID=UPI003826AFDE
MSSIYSSFGFQRSRLRAALKAGASQAQLLAVVGVTVGALSRAPRASVRSGVRPDSG